jgi:hypothetical protein
MKPSMQDPLDSKATPMVIVTARILHGERILNARQMTGRMIRNTNVGMMTSGGIIIHDSSIRAVGTLGIVKVPGNIGQILIG